MSARLYVAIGIMAILVVLWVAAYSWTTEETFEQQENDDKFLIYASFFPYYEFTKNIVGEKAEIVQFIPSGSQTHEWAPSIKKIQALTDTDVFVYNGLGMEPYVQEIIDSDEFNNIVFIKASKGIDLIKIDNEHVHDNDFKFDPHIWLDPLLVKDQVNNIMDGIILADPENTQYYKKNTIAYNMQLDELHEKIKLSLSTCNKDTIITYHDAFIANSGPFQLTIFAHFAILCLEIMPIETTSKTVAGKFLSNAIFCGTYPIMDINGEYSPDPYPNSLIFPVRYCCNPRIARKRVVLPAPLGPTMPSRSPFSTLKLISSTATWLRYPTVRFFTSST